jgi:hypothetical protein
MPDSPPSQPDSIHPVSWPSCTRHRPLAAERLGTAASTPLICWPSSRRHRHYPTPPVVGSTSCSTRRTDAATRRERRQRSVSGCVPDVPASRCAATGLPVWHRVSARISAWWPVSRQSYRRNLSPSASQNHPRNRPRINAQPPESLGGIGSMVSAISTLSGQLDAQPG